MFLVNLIYASRTNPAFNPQDIEDILRSSARNNERAGLTGILAFNSDYFLQCLEGSRDAVNDAYHRILHDRRHHDPVILSYQEVSRRQFPQWSMGYMGGFCQHRDILRRYASTVEFAPYEMSGQSATDLLLELSSRIPRKTTLGEELPAVSPHHPQGAVPVLPPRGVHATVPF